MCNHMQFHATEITENIKQNKASSTLATYYLLLNKIKAMILKMEPKKVALIIKFFRSFYCTTEVKLYLK